MQEIKKVSDVVKQVLMAMPETRSNNKLLYCEVCRRMNAGALELPFEKVFMHLDAYRLPNPETVTRCRRKIQEKHPSLSANGEVVGYRTKQEKNFRAYAKEWNV